MIYVLTLVICFGQMEGELSCVAGYVSERYHSEQDCTSAAMESGENIKRLMIAAGYPRGKIGYKCVAENEVTT